MNNAQGENQDREEQGESDVRVFDMIPEITEARSSV